jgi:hypothetical protein
MLLLFYIALCRKPDWQGIVFSFYILLSHTNTEEILLIYIYIYIQHVCVCMCVCVCRNGKYVKKSNPITGLDRPLGFQEVEAPRFLDNQNMKAVRLSALLTGRRYPPPQEIFLGLSCGRGWGDPRAIVRPKRLCQ